MKLAINILELPVGSAATVVGYSRVYGGYVGKLMSQGLLPGAPFVVLSLPIAQGGVQIMLKDRIVTLSKPEVNALCIEAEEESD